MKNLSENQKSILGALIGLTLAFSPIWISYLCYIFNL